VLGECERRALELPGDRRQPVQQCLTALDDQPDMTAQHLRSAARQVKLALSGIDPHVGVGHHQIGVAGESKSRDVEYARQALI